MMNATDFNKIHDEITNHLKTGGLVQITTYMHSTLYKAKHASYFSVDQNGVYVQSGKQKNKIVASVGPLVQIKFAHA